MTIAEIYKRIEELNARIIPLDAERQKLRDELLALTSEFKVGDVIQWKESGCRSSRLRKGRVVEFGWWLDEAQWKVEVIKVDGSIGKTRWIAPFRNPKKV